MPTLNYKVRVRVGQHGDPVGPRQWSSGGGGVLLNVKACVIDFKWRSRGEGCSFVLL